MAIHHDKHAYGNLEKLSGDMSEEEILKNLAALNGGDNGEDNDGDGGEEEGEKNDD